MPKAMELIVEAYVRFNKRDSLESLRLHRQKLAMDIKSRSAVYDRNVVLHQIEEDLAFINAGLDRLPQKEEQAI